MNVREIAMKAIYSVEFDGAYSNMAVKEALEKYSMDQRDKALFTRLVYGTTDKKLTLDYIIGQFSKLKIKKLSKFILIILRMGIYQLKFMDKIPASAAVNESVKLARRYGHGASAGYVNGILRAVSKSEIKYPEKQNEYLSVKYSFPQEQCDKWIKDFGGEFTEKLLAAFEKDFPVTLRPNRLKTSDTELAQRLCEKGILAKAEDGMVICGGFDIENDSLYREGYYTPQDRAAMTASKTLEPKSGQTVIDMCAAPGGKTTHIAELMDNKGKILAFDVHKHKIELIEKNAQRLGISIIHAENKNACELDKALYEKADRVLCDVPCSGWGIAGKKPDIKWNREDTSGLPEIQKNILFNAGKYLKKGGEMVYSTCTIEKEENEQVIQKFLEENTGFEKLYEKTFYPNVDNTDGFYICKLRKL